MADEIDKGQTPADGAQPAATPAVTTDVPQDKTPEQLDAEKKAAEEAKTKQQADDDAEELAVKKKPWFQKRIDEITLARREAERRAERSEAERQQLLERLLKAEQRGAGDVPRETQPPEEFRPTRPAPTRDQYDFDEDKYIQARVDWTIEQREEKAAHSQRIAAQKSEQTNFAEYYEKSRLKTIQDGKEKYPDFEQVVFSIPANVMTPDMALAVFQTSAPDEVSYYLGKNPEEAERIGKLPPLKKAVEIGKIESKLSAPVKKTPQAPPPVSPVGGGEQSLTNPDRLSMDDWVKARKAGKIK